MKNKRLLTILGVVALAVVAAAPVTAAEIQSLTVIAFVEDQVCINGDTVSVTLSATADSSSEPVRFRWDFTNNGSFDTAASTNPTVVRNYTDEVTRTARVGARNPEGNLAQDTVTFTTLRCTN